MDNKKNFYILLGNIVIISYLTAGLPKIFAILTKSFAHKLSIDPLMFNNILYNSTFFSLAGKILFSFLINDKSFNKNFPLYQLFVSIGILHGITIGCCLYPHLYIHIIGRYGQGLLAGIWNVILEPVIFNGSDPQWRNRLLYLKYELIALITPLAIIITNCTIHHVEWVLIAITLLSIAMATSIFQCKSLNNYYIQEQNNLLSIGGFLESLILPQVLLDNIILGSILGLFVVLSTSCFYCIFDNIDFAAMAGPLNISIIPSLMKGFCQGLNFSSAFIVAKISPRKYTQYGSIIILIILSLAMLFKSSTFYMAIFITLLYIIYVLWTPLTLTNLLDSKPHHISHRSISTASQLIRSISTLFVCKVIHKVFTKKLENHRLYIPLLILLGTGFSILLTVKNHQLSVNKKLIILGVIIIIWMIFISA